MQRKMVLKQGFRLESLTFILTSFVNFLIPYILLCRKNYNGVHEASKKQPNTPLNIH